MERKFGRVLVLVVLNINNEYIAPNTVASVMIGADRVFQSIIVEIIRSSPTNFGVGGRPKLDTHAIIHHKVSNGVTNLNPRVIERVRVPLRSYNSLAKQNRAEDINPCAIISISAPFTPQREMVKTPDATILM